MSQSLAPECTPLKHSYDACFNAWFEGYLEPAIAAGSNGGSGKNGSSAASPKAREEYSSKKAEEFEKNCGEVWRQYRSCVQVRRSQLAERTMLIVCVQLGSGEGERAGRDAEAGKRR